MFYLLAGAGGQLKALTIVYNVMGVFRTTILISNSKEGFSCLELRILLNVSGSWREHSE